MKTTIRTLFVLLVSILGTSCVEQIDMDPLEEMPVAVKCVLTNDEVQTLHLFRARRPTETGYSSISDASVTVSGDGQSHVFTWNGECWTCRFTPEFGIRYDLTIKLKDGEVITSHTTYPKYMAIIDTPVYTGFYCSMAMYCTVYGCEDEAFIWLTPMEKYADRISHFCTDHPGADNTNVTGDTWESLPMAGLVEADFQKNMGPLVTFGIDEDCVQAFRRACYRLPVHKNYLRIHHKTDAFENPSNPHIVQNFLFGKKGDLQDGFILGADYIYDKYRPGSVGLSGYYIPVKIYFLSKEYDEYLNRVVTANLRRDELTTIYSSDLNYTDIEGGNGIFGALYYYDYDFYDHD